MGIFDFFKKKQDSTNKTVNTEEIKVGNIKVSVQMGMQTRSEDDILPAEKRVKSAFPSRKNGLYPHEVLVLDYANSFYTQDNNYQRFWWTRYGVKNVDAVLHKLLKKGFIEVAPIASTLEKKTVVELKEVLKEQGLETKGKKAILIQRLLEEVPIEELDKLFPVRLYVRTEKGEEELKAEEYVSYIHRHNSIEDLDIWKLNKLVYGTAAHIPYRDVIWQYLNQRSMEHFSENDFGLYRNCRYSMSAFLAEEGKIEAELEMLAEVVFYDLCGAGNNYNPEYLYISAAYFFPYKDSLVTTTPGIAKRVFACKEKLGLTDEDLRKVLVNRMKKLSAPIQLFSIDECVDIVFYEYVEDKEALDRLYKLAEKRFHKKHPNLKKNPYH